jgi:hypothetical protein
MDLTPPKPKPITPDPDKLLAITVRRALLMIVRAVEIRYDLGDKDDRKVA